MRSAADSVDSEVDDGSSGIGSSAVGDMSGMAVEEQDLEFRDDGQCVRRGEDVFQIRLPQVLVRDVYEEYTTFCNAMRDTSGAERALNVSQFREMWKREYGYVKCSRPKGTFKVCETCARITMNMKNSKDTDEYMRMKKTRQHHLDMQRAQRRCYYENKVEGMASPEDVLSLIQDGMDQAKSNLPLLQRRSKNDSVQLMKQKVVGVIAHGHGHYIYVAQPPVVGNANLTIECLWRTILKLQERYERALWKWPGKLHLQLDNASDNKSKAFFGFAAQLIEEGVFDEVNMNFLIVGHTHEDVDQYFSVISQHLRSLMYHNASDLVISFEDFQRQLRSAFSETNKPQCVELILACHDFVSFYNIPSKHFSGMNDFHRFQITLPTKEEYDWAERVMEEGSYEQVGCGSLIDVICLILYCCRPLFGVTNTCLPKPWVGSQVKTRCKGACGRV